APDRAGHRQRLRARGLRPAGHRDGLMSGPDPERGRPDSDGAGPQTRRRPRRRGPEGEVQVFGADEQSDVAVDVERWAHLAHEVLVAEGVSGDAELSLLFVDEASMAELNQQFMEKSGPTDVLAFPIAEEGPMGRWAACE